MKFPLFIFGFVLTLCSCQTVEKSVFFDDCSCHKLDFSLGERNTDTLNHYSARFLESDWPVVRNLDEHHNGLTWYNSGSKTLEAIGITETKKGQDFVSPEEEVKHYPFNKVVDSGKIELLGEDRIWRLIVHDDQKISYYSLYLILEFEEVIYTLNLTVERGDDFKMKICRLEKFLDYFEIN